MRNVSVSNLWKLNEAPLSDLKVVVDGERKYCWSSNLRREGKLPAFGRFYIRFTFDLAFDTYTNSDAIIFCGALRISARLHKFNYALHIHWCGFCETFWSLNYKLKICLIQCAWVNKLQEGSRTAISHVANDETVCDALFGIINLTPSFTSDVKSRKVYSIIHCDIYPSYWRNFFSTLWSNAKLLTDN